METYDNIIIGFGQGPKVLANTFRAHNESVLSIEADRARYGGTCFTIGCIPSKELLYLSQQPRTLPAKENYKQAILTKLQTVEELRDLGYHMIADSGTKIINGVGSFIDNHHVEVAAPDGSTQQFEGKRIIINTGATTIMPNIPGLSTSKRAVTSTTLMDTIELPDRLTIIGGGAIGLEFASIFNNFGSKVTLIEASDQFMPGYDTETATAVHDELTAEGIRIIYGANVTEVTDNDQDTTVSMTLKGEEPFDVTADLVLVATGRRPNIDRLNLDTTDIHYTKRGVEHDDHLETNVPGVFVEGDVKGGPQLTSISLSDNRIITDHLYGKDALTVSQEQAAFPTAIFMNVPLSHIGLNEEKAIKEGHKVLTNIIPAGGTLRSRITGDTRGFLKAIVDAESHQILGATFYIEQSPEIINLVALAMHEKLPYEALTGVTYTHPVSSEMLFFLFNGMS